MKKSLFMPEARAFKPWTAGLLFKNPATARQAFSKALYFGSEEKLKILLENHSAKTILHDINADRMLFQVAVSGNRACIKFLLTNAQDKLTTQGILRGFFEAAFNLHEDIVVLFAKHQPTKKLFDEVGVDHFFYT